MSLPELIEIEPVSHPASVDVVIPGSKSLTNRALILAALAQGRVVLTGALWSEDTQVMVECLRRLGFAIEISPDPGEPANRILVVEGRGGEIPVAGSAAAPLELHVGNAGTAARFLAAFVCLGRGFFRLSGVPRMHQRPQGALLAALRQLGYGVDAADDRLPAVIEGRGPRPGRCAVSIGESSQFASALFLAGSVGGWEIEVEGENADESPYVSMTRELIAAFPMAGGEYRIEPDASSGTYFVAADWLISRALPPSEVRVPGWPASGWQIDARFPRVLPLPRVVSRQTDLGDSIMMAICLGALSSHPVEFTHLGRLRLQECERVKALRAELGNCGVVVEEAGDTLTVFPGVIRGAEIETYNDHRMAMCFATLGLVVPGMRIRNPRCVRKTFPNFFQKLAAPAPGGLGVVIRDAATGKQLAVADLDADAG